MLVFIDDSGDPGFKLDKGSSHYFVISAVIFSDELEAEKTAVAIKELRRELGFPDSVEFKFNKLRKKFVARFLQVVAPFDFKVRSIVVEKKLIRSEELKMNKKSFYAFIIKELLKYSGDEILNARIYIDGSGDRDFRRNFLSYLRREVNSIDRQVFNRCKLVDSKQNVLIQMADMVAGAVRRSYCPEKLDRNLYREIIKSHITDEWPFK